MLLLQRGDGAKTLAQGTDSFHTCRRRRQRRDARDAVLQCRAANVGVVVERLSTEGSVDHQRHFAVDHPVDDVRSLVLMDLPGQTGLYAVLLEKLAGSSGGDDVKAQSYEVARQLHDHRTLVIVVDGDE